MKKILLLIISLLIVGCNDNAYDGENGLIGGAVEKSSRYFETIQKSVLAKNAQSAVDNSQNLIATAEMFESDSSVENQSDMNAYYRNVVNNLKSIEATYVAGEYDKNLLDTLHQIDYFNRGNIDIAEDLEFIASNDGNVEDLMFKSSSKSINALEYMLYKYGEDFNKTRSEIVANPRRAQMMSIQAKYLNENFALINNLYAEENLLSDEQLSVDNIMNALIDSILKLKEWRVGDAGGFTQKYKGNPDFTRLEYHLSRYSASAMIAILNTHKSMMNEKLGIDNFGAYCISRNTQNEVDLINSQIDTALSLLYSLEGELNENVKSQRFEDLYNIVNALYSAYYSSLTAALAQSGDINIGIPDADGD